LSHYLPVNNDWGVLIHCDTGVIWAQVMSLQTYLGKGELSSRSQIKFFSLLIAVVN